MRIVRRHPDFGYLDTVLWIPKRHMNVEGTKNALTFVLDDARVITLWKETPHHVLVPREFWKVADLRFPVIDCRPTEYPRVLIESRIKLDHRPVDGVLQPTGEQVQQDALRALMAARGGILQLACGKGKTVVFLDLVAQLKVPTLIVIDNTQLMAQWESEIARHLHVPGGLGRIQASVFDWKKSIVLTTYQTLSARADVISEEVQKWFGLIGWDEGHHTGADVFSRTLDLFPGRRFALTATPRRDDGLHVCYYFHVGEVVYKDLKPELIPRIYFLWTGFRIDKEQPEIARQVLSSTKELHLKMLAGYFGRWKTRLEFICNQVRQIIAQGRRPLVISESVDECLNLWTMWRGGTALFTDLPVPTLQELADVDRAQRADAQTKLQEAQKRLQRIDEDDTAKREVVEKRIERLVARLNEIELDATTIPVEMAQREQTRLFKTVKLVMTQLRDPKLNPIKRQALNDRYREIEHRLRQHATFLAMELEIARRRRKQLDSMLDEHKNDAGLLIGDVPVATRLKFIQNQTINFSIAKYGREGLDNPDIDTVLVCEPFSSRNILQQLLGRPSRKRARKKQPVVVFLEDEIGELLGMCQKLRKHLKQWPEDEGGPLQFDVVGRPPKEKKS